MREPDLRARRPGASPAAPRRCVVTSKMLATPVAPSGWPFERSPPETFTGDATAVRRLALVDHAARLALAAETEVLVVQQLGGREAVVQLDQVEVVRTDARPARRPASRRSA